MAGQLLLDSNLAVLLAVGLTNPNYIAKHKRLQAFDAIDFAIVQSIIARYTAVIFTPNVLTETSNLLRQVADPIRTEVAKNFAEIVQRSEERAIASRIAANQPIFVRLGLTDAVLLLLAGSGATLLTVDLDLYIATQSAGLTEINYNHVRDRARLDFQPR